MADTSILRLAGDLSGNVSWVNVIAAPEKTADVGQGTLTEAATQLTGHRVIALVPSTCLLLTSAHIPTRNRQRILAAVPNVLEEQIADDIDDLHFALGQHGADGRIQVAVVAKSLMAAWLSRLHEAGIRPAMLVPDMLALPYEPGGWTLGEIDRYGLVRTGRQSGFACDLENLATLLTAALAEAGATKPEFLQTVQVTDASVVATSGIEVRALPDTVMQACSRGLDEPQLIDLLQGDYSRREQIGKLWRPWRATAALAAVWLVFHVGLTVTDYVRLSREDGRFAAQVMQVYRDTFPDARAIDISLMEREMMRRLGELRGGGAADAGLLALLSEVSQSLATTGGLELQRMSYTNGQIDLALTIKDLQDLDKLKQQLAAKPGLDVEIQSASARDNQVEARLQIKGKAS